MKHETSAAFEHATYDAKDNLGPGELMAHAARKSGRSVMKITREFWKLNRGPGKINLTEYVRYGLYDDTRYTPEQKAEFLSNDLHWALVDDTCDRAWDAVTEDKWLSTVVMQAGGLPTPRPLACIDRTGRTFGATPVLATPEDLRSFLTGATMPLFGKVLRGICSIGAFHILDADATHLHLKKDGPVSYEHFLNAMIGEGTYILQPLVENHAMLRAFCTATATVRMANMLRKDGLFTPFAAIKLPSGDNIADAFWRPGNLCADIDPKTGEIRSLVGRDGIDLAMHDKHPVTGADLIGQRLPHWDALLDLNARATALFAPVRYQTFDIALTDTGPVVIEINTGGGFDLPQHASRKGFLTPEVRDFFRECGSKNV